MQCLQFAFDPGWRRHRRQWCIGKLFAGHFQDDGAYHKWRVHLRRGDDVYWREAISAVAHGVLRRIRMMMDILNKRIHTGGDV